MTATTKQAISSHVNSLRLATLLALFTAGIAVVLTTAVVLAMLGGTGAENTRAVPGGADAPASVSFADYGERLAAAQAASSVSFADYGERLAATLAASSVSFADYGERLAAAQAASSVSFADYGERLAAAQAASSVSFPDYGERLAGER